MAATSTRRPRGAVAGDRAALALLLLLAAALRLVRLRHGLPDFVEEAIPFRRALDMVIRHDFDPHFFGYPGLAFQLQRALLVVERAVGQLAHAYGSLGDFLIRYEVDPSPMVTWARVPGVAADLMTLAAVWRIAGRTGRLPAVLAAGLVALAPVLVRTATQIVPDGVMTALVLWSLERLVSWREHGGQGRWLAAAALAGLAAGTKYPAVLLAVPLLHALVTAPPGTRVRDGVRAAVVALGAFALTTPWALFRPRSFVSGAGFELTHAATGHLGAGAWAGIGQAALLVGDLGPVALLLAAVGVGVALRGDRVTRTVVIAALPWVAVTLLARIAADRYRVPLAAMLALLAAYGADALLARVPAERRRAAGYALLALALLWQVPAAWRAAREDEDATQAAARRWIEQHVPPRAVLLQDPYTAALRDPEMRASIAAGGAFAQAGAAARRAFLARPVVNAVLVPVEVAGRSQAVLGQGAARQVRTLFASAEDANAVYHDMRLLAGVDFVAVSEPLRERFARDPVRHAGTLRWYHAIAARGWVAATFHAPGAPAVTIYRLDPAAAWDPITPGWWAEQTTGGTEAARRPEYRAWYAQHVASTADGLAKALLYAHREPLALRLAAAGIDAAPLDLEAWRVWIAAELALRAPEVAEQEFRRQVAFLATQGIDPAPVQQEWQAMRAVRSPP
jgi:4-amino-4-deoxy-L-arabinose transferase-like glycosyltransferase